jgi:SAM-dependent methyltransferase
LRRDRDPYASTEFLAWSTARTLSSTEAALIDRCLARDRSTLEAGTGGGRILLEMRRMGFTSLTGFDVVPEMVRSARTADPSGEIRFDIGDATALDYASESFDQVIYLQQVISFIEGHEARAAALREAHRVLRPGGTALFSFLWWEERRSRPFVRALGTWLRAQRVVRRRRLTVQDWPWVRRGGRPNIGALIDQGPYIHWFTTEEARERLEAAGFSVEFSGGAEAVVSLGRSGPETATSGADGSGAVYFVCRKGEAETEAVPAQPFDALSTR